MCKKEVWKQVDVEGFENYVVSNNGKVINTKTGKILKHISKYRKTNTKLVQLLNNGKIYRISVHILVAKTFLDNPNDYKHVIHLDGNGSNNSADNLRWCSYTDFIKHWQKFGINYRPVVKSSRTKVKCIETGTHYTSLAEAGRSLNIDPSSISKHIRGIYSQVKGYHFEIV